MSPVSAIASRYGSMLVLLVCLAAARRDFAGAAPAINSAIPVQRSLPNAPVDFQKEILPIFKDNCLACHNQTKAKASLILETPQTILKGGESGPALVPGHGLDSLLVKAAAHQIDTRMPPKDNKVNAADLTPEQLGRIVRWIDQGAKGEVKQTEPVHWEALPATLNSIFAVAVSKDAQTAACARANRVFLYRLATGEEMGELSDPNCQGAAHHDLVHAVAFHPAGGLVASAGYRAIKLWRRGELAPVRQFDSIEAQAFLSQATTPDGQWLLTGNAEGKVFVWSLRDGTQHRVWSAHSRAVTALQVSEDGQAILTGSADGGARVWDLRSGELEVEVQSPVSIQSLAWISTNQFVAGGTDGVIRLWQLPKPQEKPLLIRPWKAHAGMVTSLAAVSRKRGHFLSAGTDGDVLEWELPSGNLIRKMAHGGPVEIVAVRPDGQRYASGGSDKRIKLWQAEDGKGLAEISAEKEASDAVAELTREIDFAAGELSFWKSQESAGEAEFKKEQEALKKKSDAKKSADTAFSEKQKGLAIAAKTKADADRQLAEYKAQAQKAAEAKKQTEHAAQEAAQNGKAVVEQFKASEIAAERARQVQADLEAAAQNLEKLLTRTNVGPATLPAETRDISERTRALANKARSDLAAKETVAARAQSAVEKALAEIAAKAFESGRAEAEFARFSKNNAEPALVEKTKSAAREFADIEKEFKRVEVARLNADNDYDLALRTVAKATNAVMAAKAAILKFQTARQNVEARLVLSKKTLAAAESPVRALAFSRDNRLLASGGDDALVHLWSADSGEACETLRSHRGAVLALSFAGSNLLASADARGCGLVWPTRRTWQLERVLGSEESDSLVVDRVNAIAFSPDGTMLASGSGEPSRSGQIQLWEVATGALKREFKEVHSDAVLGLAFSPDGALLASGAADKFVKVTDLASGKVIKTFEGHLHHVLDVSWSADGRLLASGSADGALKIWDFVKGEPKKTIAASAKEITSVRFAGYSDQLLTASGDGRVRLIDPDGKELRSFAGDTDFVYASAVSPDTRWVMAGGQDSILRLWERANGKLVRTFPPNPQNKWDAEHRIPTVFYEPPIVR